MMYGSAGNVGSGGAASPNPNPNIAYPLLHHHELHHTFMIPLQPPPSLPPFVGGADDGEWSNQETRDLIESRAQLEWAFTAANPGGNWWEVVADRMRDKGYRRTADQCKYKWTNLVDGFMGQEAYGVDNVPPFFNELHAVITARANRMQQQSHVEAETGVVRGKRLKDSSEDQSYEEFTEEQEEDEEIEVNHRILKGRRVSPKRKAGREKRQKIAPLTNANKNGSIVNGLEEIMRNFVRQQQRIDMEWRESMKKHAEERERFEQEWRQKMESLEREKLMMEQAWREREEERRVRDERRAEKRDALLSALLNKLIHEETT